MVDTHIVYLGVVVAFVKKKPVAFSRAHKQFGVGFGFASCASPAQKKIKPEIHPHQQTAASDKKVKSAIPAMKTDPSASDASLPALHSVTDLLADDDASPGAMLEGLGGFQVRYFKLIPAGSSNKVPRETDDIRKGFEYMRQFGPQENANGEFTSWTEKEVNNPNSPLRKWDRVTIKEFLRCLADQGSQANTIKDWSLTFKSLTSWALNHIEAPILPHVLEHAIIARALCPILCQPLHRPFGCCKKIVVMRPHPFKLLVTWITSQTVGTKLLQLEEPIVGTGRVGDLPCKADAMETWSFDVVIWQHLPVCVADDILKLVLGVVPTDPTVIARGGLAAS